MSLSTLKSNEILFIPEEIVQLFKVWIGSHLGCFLWSILAPHLGYNLSSKLHWSQIANSIHRSIIAKYITFNGFKMIPNLQLASKSKEYMSSMTFPNVSVSNMCQSFFITDLIYLISQHILNQPYRKDLIIHHVAALIIHYCSQKYEPSLWILACISEILTVFTGLASLSDWHKNKQLSKVIVAIRLMSIIFVRLPLWIYLLYLPLVKNVVQSWIIASSSGVLFLILDSYWIYTGFKKLFS
jgi:hypothetical protein